MNNSQSKLKILLKKSNNDIKTPLRATPGSAGVDIFVNEKVTVPPKGQVLVKTGLFVAIPEGYWLQIFPRSGLAMKAITVGGGVIDSDYRHEIGVILYNLSDKELVLDPEDPNGKLNRCAQMIMIKTEQFEFEEVDSLPETFRDGGFGSTTAHTRSENVEKLEEEFNAFLNTEVVNYPLGMDTLHKFRAWLLETSDRDYIYDLRFIQYWLPRLGHRVQNDVKVTSPPPSDMELVYLPAEVRCRGKSSKNEE